MRVYELGGVSDDVLIKPPTKTRAPVAPPLSAAEQRHVAERLVGFNVALRASCAGSLVSFRLRKGARFARPGHENASAQHRQREQARRILLAIQCPDRLDQPASRFAR